MAGAFWKKLLLRSLVSLVAFCFLVVLLLGIVLRSGMHFDQLHLGPVVADNLHLTWKNRLELTVDTLEIDRPGQSATQSSILENIGRILGVTRNILQLFSLLRVEQLKIGKTGVLVSLEELSAGDHTLIVQSSDVDLQAKLHFEKRILIARLTSASLDQYKTSFSGELRLADGVNLLSGRLLATLPANLSVVIDVTADTRQLSFKGQGQGQISTITPIVELFGLDPGIQRWITDYLKATSYGLNNIRGQLPWNNPAAILDSLYAEVRMEGAEYSFAQGFQPIISKYTDVTFSNRVLDIRPQEATFYGQGLEQSWLDINFTDASNITLTAHIQTQASINKDILRLLEYYKISLPFSQQQGTTRTELTLAVNLSKTKVAARGEFYIKEGLFDFGDTTYGVEDARISLVETRVTIKSLRFSSKELFSADLSGWIEAGNGTAELDIQLRKFLLKLGQSTLKLDPQKPAPVVRYHMKPAGDIIDVSHSFWDLDGLPHDLGAFTAPFKTDDLSAVLPPVILNFGKGIQASLSGSFSIKKKLADLNCQLVKFHARDLILLDKSVRLDIRYDRGFTITSLDQANWTLNTVLLVISPAKFSYVNALLTFNGVRITYGQFFDANISGGYHFLDKMGTFSIENVHPRKLNIAEESELAGKLRVDVKAKDDRFVLNVPQLGLRVSSSDNDLWLAEIDDLSLTREHLAILRLLQIDSGQLRVSSSRKAEEYIISADILTSSPLLVKGGAVVDRLAIKGKIDGKGFSAIINDNLTVSMADNHITIRSDEIGYSIPGMHTLYEGLSKRPAEKKTSRQKKTLSVEAKNSTLYLGPRSTLPADSIIVESDGNKLTLVLKHGPGKIDLELADRQFSMSGKGFTDQFINDLLGGAKFFGGELAMAAKGSFEEFSLLVTIKNTMVKEFSVLNNLMAFLNTVPALITFSLPGFHIEGVPVDSLIVGAVIKDGKAKLEKASLTSSQLDVNGSGWIDFTRSTIDLDLNLILQAAQNIRRIPLLGYILSGDEKRPSITVKVQGDLDSPEISQSTFREMVSLPFAALSRTLGLPAHLVRSLDGGEADGPADSR